MTELPKMAAKFDHAHGPPGKKLSPRERQSLEHLAQGESRAQAAHAMGISEHTLRTYIETASTKLGAKNTTHACVLLMAQDMQAPKALLLPEAEDTVLRALLERKDKFTPAPQSWSDPLRDIASSLGYNDMGQLRDVIQSIQDRFFEERQLNIPQIFDFVDTSQSSDISTSLEIDKVFE